MFYVYLLNDIATKLVLSIHLHVTQQNKQTK